MADINIKIYRSDNGRDFGDPILSINTTTAGVMTDFFVDQPPHEGYWWYRIVVIDQNNHVVGKTGIIALALSK